MARKRYSDEDIPKLLREIELNLDSGQDVASECRSVGVSDATYYNWRKWFCGMGRSQLPELKAPQKQNGRLETTPLGGALLACQAHHGRTATWSRSMRVYGMSCWMGRSSTPFGRRRSSSRAGDSTTIRFGRTPHWATGHRLRRCSCQPSPPGRLRSPDRLRRPGSP